MQKTTLLFLLAFAQSVSQQVTTTLVQTTAFETIPPYTGTRVQCAEAWNSGHPVVLYASWGPLNGNPVNVTDKVIAIYNNGSRNVQPSTDVFGDPAPGQIKYLSLATVENNRVSTFYARESTGSVPIPSSTDRAYECNQSWNKHHPVIMQARWSSTTSSRSLDVTEKVIQMFQSGTRQFNATNDMWTEIALGEVKQLSIFYFYKGVAVSTSAREGGVVSLPVPVALCAEAWNSGHPAILYASWGPLNYPIDVTDKVIAIYNNGGRSVQPSTKVFGDPAPGQIKYLSLATVVNIHHSDVAYIEVSNVSTFYAQESTNNVTIPSNPYQSFPSNSMTTAFECNQSWNKHHPVIIQALWRSTESNRISDVTEKVIQMFDSGTRQFRATGDMWGQIAYTQVKQLSIFYFYNRLANSATAREGGVATLPVA